MFLQHEMEISAAKAVGAHATAPGVAVARFPGAGFMVESEGRAAEINVGVWRFRMKRGRQNFMMNGQGGFEQTGRPRPRLQMADVAFG